MQEVSVNLLKKKLIRYPHLNELETFLERIKEATPELILLFGSLSRGDYTQYSDIDVLCVFNQEFSSRKERFLKAYKYSDGLVQTKTLTLKELKNGLKEANSFLHAIFNDGLILFSKISYDDLNSWIRDGKKKLKMTYFP